MGFNNLRSFSLEVQKDMMEFTNIARTIEDNKEDEEVWLELQSYRDRSIKRSRRKNDGR